MQNYVRRILIVGLLMVSSSLFSQTIPQCGFDSIVRSMDRQRPGFYDQFLSNFNTPVLPENPLFRTLSQGEFDTTYRIPVVVHIIYNTVLENLPDSLVHNQIDALNDAFNRTSSDTSKTRPIFKPIARSAQIEFYLADTDPNGNPTTGIVRVPTNRATFGTLPIDSIDQIKFTAKGGSDAWDSDRYLNIWVGDISLPDFGDVLLGYAYPPVNAPNWPSEYYMPKQFQGCVIHYKVFGKNNPLTNPNLTFSAEGKTTVHEVGHYLGLRHIWGDSGGCAGDDGIDDTPNAQSASNYNCNFNQNSCVDPNGNPPDMVENFMDYSGDPCQNMFTNQQVLRMRKNLRSLRPRVAQKQFTEGPGGTDNKDLYLARNNNSDSWTIHIRYSSTSPVELRIVDLQGRIMFKDQVVVNGSMDLPWPDHITQRGIYLIQVVNPGWNDSVKAGFLN